ncbi:hypothetical protein [Ruegeria sp.]|uniref:hypothetical protein n=1 Tax=Ruegeria sp. TaxID=1879320 RepID=UPI003B00C8E6
MKHRSHALAAACLAAFLALFPPGPAAALFGFGGVVFDPTNHAQNVLTATRALEQINNQIRALQNQASMLQNMAKNLERLDVSTLGRMQAALTRLTSDIFSYKSLILLCLGCQKALHGLFSPAIVSEC